MTYRLTAAAVVLILTLAVVLVAATLSTAPTANYLSDTGDYKNDNFDGNRAIEGMADAIPAGIVVGILGLVALHVRANAQI